MLAVIGGVLGIGLAFGGIRLLLTYVLPRDLPGWEQIGLDNRVLLATALITVVSAVMFGLVPAVVSSKAHLRDRLQQGGRGRLGPGRYHLGQALLITEVALALAMLVSSGLITKSLIALNDVDMGFRTDDLLTFRVSPPFTTYPAWSDVRRFHRDLQERIATLPGVQGLGVSSGAPVGTGSTVLVSIPAGGASQDLPRRSAEYRVVNSSYRDVLELEMVAGRWFDERIDLVDGTKVAVVSRALTQAQWPDAREAIGQDLEVSGEITEIVGVVEGGRANGPQLRPPAMVFRPTSQTNHRSLFYVVEAELERGPLVSAIRGELHALNPEVALYRVGAVERQVQAMLGPQVAALRLFSTLAAVAILLTLVGVYGVMSHEVSSRTREMGLRMALGADSRKLRWHVLVQSIRLTAVGLGCGLALSLATGPAIAFLLVGVSPYDPGVLAAVSGLTLLAALIASYLPARRASLVDPVAALSAD